ncbi:hypothetical protein C9374_008982 [Naegleria lovaniensis]|uniref:Protein kinase domain-containing protein n=1 Tax=Naegleria lovaniensis TaxID=51637 RepID=A0AA88GIC1_NAELO|nr:uncharacterized protein C9374_008982 [Naegleria lovaniensis]KAG2377897.1 hypothetical protein C9374_008982 [Naegleria lovaniensis]
MQQTMWHDTNIVETTPMNKLATINQDSQFCYSTFLINSFIRNLFITKTEPSHLQHHRFGWKAMSHLCVVVVVMLWLWLSIFLQRHQDTLSYHVRKFQPPPYGIQTQVLALHTDSSSWPSSDVRSARSNRDDTQGADALERQNLNSGEYSMWRVESQSGDNILNCSSSYTNFTLKFYVGTTNTQQSNFLTPMHQDRIFTPNETCGNSSKNPCEQMGQVFDYINERMMQDSVNYKCLNYNITIVVLHNMMERQLYTRVVCGNKIVNIDKSKNDVKLSLTITSDSSTKLHTLSCSYMYGEPFVTDPSSITSLYLENIVMDSMVLSPVRIYNSFLTNTRVSFIELEKVNITKAQILDSEITFFQVSQVYMYDVTVSGGLTMTDCSNIYLEEFEFYEIVYGIGEPFIKIQNVEKLVFNSSQFELGRKSKVTISIAIDIYIQNTVFIYRDLKYEQPYEEEDYGLVIKLFIRLFIIDSTFKKRNSLQGWLKLISGGYAMIQQSHVLDNVCTKAESIFFFYLCENVAIIESTFKNNEAPHGGGIMASRVNEFSIYGSEFTNNTARLGGGGAVSLLELADWFDIRHTTFVLNSARYGGAIYLSNGVGGSLNVKNCSFVENYAWEAGGALYTVNSTYIALWNSNFESNQVKSSVDLNDSYETGCSCITTSIAPIGTGGAVSLFNTLSYFSNTTFSKNDAKRGGAIFTTSTCNVQRSTFSENSASISGGALFFVTKPPLLNQVELLDNRAGVYGFDTASPTMAFTQSIIEPKLNDRKISVYLGEQLVIKFKDMTDRKGNIISVMYECPTVSLSDPRFTLTRNDSKFKENLLELGILAKPTIEHLEFGEDMINLTLHLGFSQTQVHNLTIYIQECPTDFVIQNGKCEIGFPFSTVIPGIIAGTVVATLLGIVLGSLSCLGCAFASWKIYRVARGVYLRQRSEKEIEEKLLVHDLSISDYGSMNSSAEERPSLLGKNASNYIISASELKIEKKIGEGASGSVFKAKYNMMDCAVKTIIKKEDAHENFEKEVMLLVQLRHPNIISFYGICISENQLCMVVELGQNGSLEEMIKEMKKGRVKKKFKEKLKILIGISNGMKYLHGIQPKCLIHRDLKPANIILDHSNTPKVCDFGLSREISTHTQTHSLTGNIGTLIYMSPELILEEDSDNGPNNLMKENATKIDVYSFAIIMYELLFEETPYWNENCEKLNYFHHLNAEKKVKAFNLLYHVANNEKRPLVPFLNVDEMRSWCEKFMINDDPTNDEFLIGMDMYVKLMKQCWSTNPIERPSFERILQKLTDIYNMEL